MIRLLLAGLLALAVPAVADPVRVVDDIGEVLELPRPPQRIVSLAPHLTELVFAVGAGAQLVGADAASDFPDAAKRLPRVGDASRINFERVLALKPDLVIAWVGGNRPVDLHALRRLGVPLLQTQARRLDDVARLLRLVGAASGQAAAGEAAAARVSAELAALRVESAQPTAVFYQVWDHPLMTIGGTHWISDAIALCGGRNVFADLSAPAPVVSREAVLARAPAVIVSGSDAPDPQPTWQDYAGLPAVKQGGFVRVDADRLHRATPRLVEGVAALCAALAPYVR